MGSYRVQQVHELARIVAETLSKPQISQCELSSKIRFAHVQFIIVVCYANNAPRSQDELINLQILCTYQRSQIIPKSTQLLLQLLDFTPLP